MSNSKYEPAGRTHVRLALLLRREECFPGDGLRNQDRLDRTAFGRHQHRLPGVHLALHRVGLPRGIQPEPLRRRARAQPPPGGGSSCGPGTRRTLRGRAPARCHCSCSRRTARACPGRRCSRSTCRSAPGAPPRCRARRPPSTPAPTARGRSRRRSVPPPPRPRTAADRSPARRSPRGRPLRLAHHRPLRGRDPSAAAGEAGAGRAGAGHGPGGVPGGVRRTPSEPCGAGSFRTPGVRAAVPVPYVPRTGRYPPVKVLRQVHSCPTGGSRWKTGADPQP